MNNQENVYYGHVRKQILTLNQRIDATVSFYNGEMYRIMNKFSAIEDLEMFDKVFISDNIVLKARYSKDKNHPNKYIIEEIFETHLK